MKKQSTWKWAALSLALLFSASTQAQTLKEFFSNEETNIFYVGIDFTKNKLIDVPDANTSDIRDRQYDGLNALVVNEGKKYDVKSAFHRKNTPDHDMSLVNERNEKADASAISSTNSGDYHRLKEADIDALVRGFDFKGQKGLGVLLVCEAMSKSEKAIAVWVTFVDMSSRKVLLTDRVEGKIGMGFGFRNYWATGIKSLFEQIEKKKYKEWKAKVGA